MTRAGLATVLGKQPDIEVCCEASAPREALSLLTSIQNPPDLIITDLTMPDRGGLEFIKDVRTVRPASRILVLSMHDEMLYAERALRAGARGYVMKEAGAETVLRAARAVLKGEICLSPSVAHRLLESVSEGPSNPKSPLQSLTDREFQILNLIGHGRSTKEIATQLKLSPKTVDVYRAAIKGKLKLPDALALVRYAVSWVETQRQ